MKGAYLDQRDGRWFASIRLVNRNVYLGTFESRDEAHAAYAKAVKEIWGEYANVA